MAKQNPSRLTSRGVVLKRPPGIATSQATPSDTATGDGRARKAMFGAWFGFFVDLFDIYLPIVVLVACRH